MSSTLKVAVVERAGASGGPRRQSGRGRAACFALWRARSRRREGGRGPSHGVVRRRARNRVPGRPVAGSACFSRPARRASRERGRAGSQERRRRSSSIAPSARHLPPRGKGGKAATTIRSIGPSWEKGPLISPSPRRGEGGPAGRMGCGPLLRSWQSCTTTRARAFDEAFLLSTPHSSGFARHPRVCARGQALPHFVEKGPPRRPGRTRLPRRWPGRDTAQRRRNDRLLGGAVGVRTFIPSGLTRGSPREARPDRSRGVTLHSWQSCTTARVTFRSR